MNELEKRLNDILMYAINTKDDLSEFITEDQKKTFELIKQALKTPTAEEVCEALGQYFGRLIKYQKVTKEFYYRVNNLDSFVTETYLDGKYTLGCYLPPYLITMIGKFYEGVVSKND